MALELIDKWILVVIAVEVCQNEVTRGLFKKVLNEVAPIRDQLLMYLYI